LLDEIEHEGQVVRQDDHLTTLRLFDQALGDVGAAFVV
jgi:hypothetical protein